MGWIENIDMTNSDIKIIFFMLTGCHMALKK